MPQEPTFSRTSLICSSILCSSSLGCGSMSLFAANCEKVWNNVSVCQSGQSPLRCRGCFDRRTCVSCALACWRTCAQVFREVILPSNVNIWVNALQWSLTKIALPPLAVPPYTFHETASGMYKLCLPKKFSERLARLCWLRLPTSGRSRRNLRSWHHTELLLDIAERATSSTRADVYPRELTTNFHIGIHHGMRILQGR